MKIEFFCTGAKLLHVHCVSQFSRQPLTPFESRFDFSDLLNLPKLMQRPKRFRRANRQRRFSRQLTSSHAPAGARCFSVFSATADPFQVPFRFSRTDSTDLSLCKGRKCSAARIGDDDIRGCSPLVMVLHQDSVSQFSRQPSTTSEPSFEFPDQCNTFNHLQRLKTFRRAN
jgi:hypothetical protein